jgi:hypothetical protein
MFFVGILVIVIGVDLYILYVNAPNYRSDPNLSGFGVARNQTGIYPSFFVVIVSIDPDELFFQYYFTCDTQGTYNFLFVFPFKIKSILDSTLGINFNSTSRGSAVWISYPVSHEGSYNVYGQFEIEDTFRIGTQGSYIFLLPFGRGIHPDVIGNLQSELRVTFFSPDNSQIDLSFLVPDSFQILQTIPPTKGAPESMPSAYRKTMTGVSWGFTQLRDSIAIYCQKPDEIRRYQTLLFFSGLFISIGGEIFVTLLYDYVKTEASEKKKALYAAEKLASCDAELPLGKLYWREWLDALRAEYNSLTTYRLEWAKIGHNYGWIVIPISLTLPAIVVGYVAQQKESRTALLFAFVGCWFLLFFWRFIHHQYDNQIRLLYPRVIEIEEILGLESTRIWLRNQWKLDHLPSKHDALVRAAKRVDFSRGHLTLDCFCILYFIFTATVIYLLWSTGWLI